MVRMVHAANSSLMLGVYNVSRCAVVKKQQFTKERMTLPKRVPDGGLQQGVGVSVDTGGGLVHDQHLRTHQQDSGHADELKGSQCPEAVSRRAKAERGVSFDACGDFWGRWIGMGAAAH